MRKTITTKSAQEKISSNGGKYLSIEALEGRFTCWEEVLFPLLLANLNLPLEVEIFQKGKYENIVGAGDMMPTQSASKQFFPKKESAIGKAMDRKEKSIGDFAARKEDSIKLAGAQRDAVLLTTTFYPEYTTNPNKDNLIREKFEEWKSYFLGYDVMP